MASVGELVRALAIATVLIGITAPAFADTATAAEALFDEGRRLMKKGDYPAACAKLAESYRLDPAGGTLMNLAACHEAQGKTATAWREFKDALSRAMQDRRDDRIEEAKRKLAELEPKLARIRISVGEHAPRGIEIRLDGTSLGSASFGVMLPVDPGEHAIVASAPGYEPWSTQHSIRAAATDEIAVPALKRAPERAVVGDKKAPPPQVSAGATSGPPALAYVIGGVGIVGVGVGSYFGLVARSKKNKSENECTSDGCTPDGAELLKDANRAAWVSNIGFGVGLAGLGVATYLFIASSHSSDEPRAIRVAPNVGRRSMALEAVGVW